LLGGVDAFGGVLDRADEDGVAVLEDTELFEFFEFLQGTLGQLRDLGDEGLAIGVDADVAQVVVRRTDAPFVSVVRDGTAGEVDRPCGCGARYASVVERRATSDELRNDRLDDVGVGDLLGLSQRRRQRRHGNVGVLDQETGEGVDVIRVDFGLVALDVDDDIDVQTGHRLGDAIGAALVIGAGQDAGGPEALGRSDDAFVVGRNQDALGQPGLAGLLVRVLDEVFAGVLGENFPGESGRIVPRRYTDYDLHRRSNSYVYTVIRLKWLYLWEKERPRCGYAPQLK